MFKQKWEDHMEKVHEPVITDGIIEFEIYFC